MKTRKELQNRINRLEKELQQETETNGSVTKRTVFLKSSINLYLKELGKPEKYEW